MTTAQQREQKGERKAALRIALTMLQNGVERSVFMKPGRFSGDRALSPSQQRGGHDRLCQTWQAAARPGHCPPYC